MANVDRIYDIRPGATYGPTYVGEVTGSSDANLTIAYTAITKRAPIAGDHITWLDSAAYFLAVFTTAWQAIPTVV